MSKKPHTVSALVLPFLLAVGLLVGTVQSSAAGEALVGGYSEVPTTNEQVIAAAQFAVTTQSISTESGPEITIVEILGAQQKVVAGMNYRLQLKVKVDGEENQAEVVVWWQAWRKPNPYRLTSWTWSRTGSTPMAGAVSASLLDLHDKAYVSITNRGTVAKLLTFFAEGKPITGNTYHIGAGEYQVSFTMPEQTTLGVLVSSSVWESNEIQGQMQSGWREHFKTLLTSDMTAVAQPPTDAWLIGNVPPSPAMQRVSDTATGKAVLIQEQTIGRVPVVFESQSRCLKEAPQSRSPLDHVPSESPLPHPLGSLTQTNLVMAKGRWVSEVLPTDTYSGVKEFAGVTNVGYTYFLSEDRFSTGTPICVTANTNGITITLGRMSLPVSSLPLFVEVVDDIARQELGWTNGVLRSNEALTLSVPLRNLPPDTSGPVVSVHLTNRRGLSLLSGGSYLDAYFGWTNGVSRLDTLLKTEKSSVLFSIHLRLDLESGQIWN